MVNLMGVSLSWLEANHKVLCLHRMITMQGVDQVEFITFEGCNVPGEGQAQTTN